MNVLFAHDHKFFCSSDGLYYSHGAYPSEHWSRYMLGEKTKVHVIARHGGEDTAVASKFILSSAANVDFHLIKAVPSLWRFGVYKGASVKTIESYVESVSSVVVRLPSELGLLAASLAIKHNKNLIVELVGCARDAYKYRGDMVSYLYSYFSALRTRRAVKAASSVLYVARYLADLYPCRLSARKVFCTNAVIKSIAADDILITRYLRIKKQLANKEALKVGLIGSFSNDYKGISVGIKAIARLNKKNIAARLHILGEGDQEKYISQAKKLGVESCLIFDGVLPAGSAVNDWLDSCDLYIQPSYTEGLPRGLLEAMARGVPAAASSVGGIPEIISPNYLHKPGDDLALSNCLMLLLSVDFLSEMRKNTELASSYHQNILSPIREDFYMWSLEK